MEKVGWQRPRRISETLTQYVAIWSYFMWIQKRARDNTAWPPAWAEAVESSDWSAGIEVPRRPELMTPGEYISKFRSRSCIDDYPQRKRRLFG